MKLNWQSTDIQPNDGDIVVTFRFGTQVFNNRYIIGIYVLSENAIKIRNTNNETEFLSFDYYDLWTKIDLPEMPVC